MVQADPNSPLDRWLARIEGRHSSAIDLGLDRCRRVYEALGTPRPAETVITVAGTNGKGSTVAWIESSLLSLGRSCGAYTSPHLLRFNERLRVNGKAVTDAALVEAFEQVEHARGDTSLTFFEFTTLACFIIMAKDALDVAILEVGLGGRLDTVNLVDADLAVITPVALDHQSWLGPDRESIGREKAGILRQGIPLVLAEPHPPESVLAHAHALNCRVLKNGEDFSVDNDGSTFTMGDLQLSLPERELKGAHQHQNLAAALAAIEVGYSPGGAGWTRILDDLARVGVSGRLQSIKHAATDTQVTIDVGHNPLAARAVRAYFEGRGVNQVLLVLAMVEDKDADAVMEQLGPLVKTVYCATLEDEQRGQTGAELALKIQGHIGKKQIRIHGSIQEALSNALSAAGPDHEVLVFGSFITAAQALTFLQRN